jgi:hypothetical protein
MTESRCPAPLRVQGHDFAQEAEYRLRRQEAVMKGDTGRHRRRVEIPSTCPIHDSRDGS